LIESKLDWGLCYWRHSLDVSVSWTAATVVRFIREMMCIFMTATLKGGPMCIATVIVAMKAMRLRIMVAEGTVESDKLSDPLDRNRLDEPMKILNPLTRFLRFLTIALLVSVWSVLPANLYATEQKEAQQKPGVAQRLFASPDEAVKVLQAATEAKDKAALYEIFGTEFRELLTGDEVQDTNNAKKFATVIAQGYKLVKEGEDKITIEVGTNSWPMPIPLVKSNGQWHFDTAAGKDEIISRHIGKDELHAIGVCRAYVVAQRQYAKEVGGGSKFAQKFKSAPGKKDGLYWRTVGNEPSSPFGPLVAEAHAEGYRHNQATGPHSFHGYYFRILTRQGKVAPGGKMNYMSHDNLTGGFALVAYPERWDKSGVMTFIVNQDGQVFQRNLGEKTSRTAEAMKDYNPDSNWTLVKDDGVLSAVSEK
jgi:hypothetical protein